MNPKVLQKLTSGVFMVASKFNGKLNGCITNTCIQVTNNPTKLAISILNTTHTCQMIKQSHVFTLSILSQDCTFDLIKKFGYTQGKNTNKFGDMLVPVDLNGVPYLNFQSCGFISCKVDQMIDLGTHTLFIGDVVDSQILQNKQPLTYDFYQEHIKPKKIDITTSKTKKIIGWRCKICGYVYNQSEMPDDYLCPLCGHPKEDFEPIYADE